ncbi:MAG TPA: ribbon-helix-helix protein, CopG family [Burkholderiales bacterium]|jgi:hypothetical protein|nr:ribbon-helix-helix protein, CopG family [Burkholderiales bacterium]
MKTLSFKVPETLDRKLAAVVKRRGVGKSILVREALARYLDESPAVRRGSFLDLSSDLLGCVKDAPADLSSGPRHLADFGK